MSAPKSSEIRWGSDWDAPSLFASKKPEQENQPHIKSQQYQRNSQQQELERPKQQQQQRQRQEDDRASLFHSTSAATHASPQVSRVSLLSNQQSSQIHAQLEESNRTLFACLQVASETQITAAETNAELERQSEKLSSAQRKMDDLHANVAHSERILRGMESVWGRVATSWRPKSAEGISTVSSSGSSPRSESLVDARRPSAPLHQRNLSEPSLFSQLPAPLAADERVVQLANEQDRMLEQLSSNVRSIKSMADDMGLVIDRQTGQLSALDSSVDRGLGSIKHVTRRTANLT